MLQPPGSLLTCFCCLVATTPSTVSFFSARHEDFVASSRSLRVPLVTVRYSEVMDPLSVAAGVAGLLSLTIQLIQISTSIATDAKAAQAYNFIAELNTLADVLKRLGAFLNEQSQTGVSFTQVSVLVATNTRCEHKFKELLQKLQRTVFQTNKIKRALDSVLWPLSKKEHTETTGNIRPFPLRPYRRGILTASEIFYRGSRIIQRTVTKARGDQEPMYCDPRHGDPGRIVPRSDLELAGSGTDAG